ncbi:hypothetical protein GQX74_013223 [Glossina fuscipes]|nr:hypothetical protein GQX74_013223 [Glossina fuscipes]
MALMCIMKDSKVFKVSICGCSQAVGNMLTIMTTGYWNLKKFLEKSFIPVIFVNREKCSELHDVSSSLDIPSRCELSRSLRSRSQRRRVRRPSRSVARRICSSDSAPRRDEEGSKEKGNKKRTSRISCGVLNDDDLVLSFFTFDELSNCCGFSKVHLAYACSNKLEVDLDVDVKKNDNNNLTTKSSVRISVWILSLLLLRCSVEPPMDVVVEPKL